MGKRAATILAGSPALGPNSELVGDQCEDKGESQNYVTVVGMCVYTHAHAQRAHAHTHLSGNLSTFMSSSTRVSS